MVDWNPHAKLRPELEQYLVCIDEWDCWREAFCQPCGWQNRAENLVKELVNDD